MQLLLLVAGIVGVVLPQHFDQQHTLGWVFIALFAFITLLQLLAFIVAARSMSREVGGIRTRPVAGRRSTRYRRGF